MKTPTICVLIIGLLIILGLGWYMLGSHPPAPTTSTATLSASITLSSNGFSPSAVTIKKGGTVTWANAGGGEMWVASNDHPTHTKYAGTSRAQHCPDVSGTAFDQCAPSGSYSFTFSKIGNWQYHNHMNASQVGEVVVVE